MKITYSPHSYFKEKYGLSDVKALVNGNVSLPFINQKIASAKVYEEDGKSFEHWTSFMVKDEGVENFEESLAYKIINDKNIHSEMGLVAKDIGSDTMEFYIIYYDLKNSYFKPTWTKKIPANFDSYIVDIEYLFQFKDGGFLPIVIRHDNDAIAGSFAGAVIRDLNDLIYNPEKFFFQRAKSFNISLMNTTEEESNMYELEYCDTIGMLHTYKFYDWLNGWATIVKSLSSIRVVYIEEKSKESNHNIFSPVHGYRYSNTLQIDENKN